MPDIARMRTLGWGDPDAPDFRAKHIKTLHAAGVAIPVNADPNIQYIFRVLLEFLDGLGAQIAKERDDWGYANRPIRGASEKSYHAWGLAVDVNALRNPMGQARTTFNVVKTNRLCARLGLRWGENYSSRKDPMHFEFLGSPADAARIVRSLKARKPLLALAAAVGLPVATLLSSGLIAPAPAPTPTVTKTVTPTVSPSSTRPTATTSPATATTPTGKPSTPSTPATPSVKPTSVPTVTRTTTKTIQVPTRVTVTKTVTKTVTVTKTRDYVIVRTGDTLYRIATAAKTTVTKVRALNPSLDPLNLQPGTLVRVK